jgi:hypothetical protein
LPEAEQMDVRKEIAAAAGRPSPLCVNCSGTRCPASRRLASRHSISRKSRSRLKWWCVSPKEGNTGHEATAISCAPLSGVGQTGGPFLMTPQCEQHATPPWDDDFGF